MSAIELPPAPPLATSQAPQAPQSDEAGAAATAKEAEPIYALPIFGEAAIKAGASLPLPIGISVIGQYQRENIRAHNLQVGLGQGPLINADFVGFNSLTTRVRNLIFRGDLWLFPFLNIYGLAGESWSSTTTSLAAPLSLVIPTDSSGATLGFGGTIAYGIDPYGFITLDANLTWSDQDILTMPARTLTVTPRLGHRFKSQTIPDRAFELWVGATMEEFENADVGNVALGGALGGNLQSFLTPALLAWINNLPPAQHAAANQLLGELAVLPNLNTARASFNLNVNPSKAWNLIVGGQMEMTKHWTLIAEAGLLGSRTSVVGNVCYRFGI